MASVPATDFSVPAFVGPEFTFACPDGDVKCPLFPLWMASSVIRNFAGDMSAMVMPIHYAAAMMKQFVFHVCQPVIDTCNGKLETKYAYIPWRLYRVFQMLETWHAENFDLFDYSDFHPYKMTMEQQRLIGKIHPRFMVVSGGRTIVPSSEIPSEFDAYITGGYALTDSADINQHIIDDFLVSLAVHICSRKASLRHESKTWEEIRKNKQLLVRVLKLLIEKVIPDESFQVCEGAVLEIQRFARIEENLTPLLEEHFESKLPYTLAASVRSIVTGGSSSINGIGLHNRKADSKSINLRLKDDFLNKRLHYNYSKTKLYCGDDVSTFSVYFGWSTPGWHTRSCFIAMDKELADFCLENVEYLVQFMDESSEAAFRKGFQREAEMRRKKIAEEQHLQIHEIVDEVMQKTTSSLNLP